MSAMMEDRTNYIRVTNGNSKPVHGRYAGRDYVFKPGVPLDVPEAVARHVFDFGKDDKAQALNRLGWAKSSDDLDAGMAMLAKISFDDPPELIEAPKAQVEGKRGRKALPHSTGAAGPPVNAGGTEGGGFNSPPDGPKIGEAESAEGADEDNF
jgi:hypothetical protein